MALVGTERVRYVGVINGSPAAVQSSTTTQNLANLANGGSSNLTGLEPLYVHGVAANGNPAAYFERTTTGAIAVLGSIAPSTLAGNEIILLEPTETGSSPGANLRQATSQNIANS